MSTPQSQEAISAALREIQAHLDGPRAFPRFSPALAAGFHQLMRQRSLQLLHQGWWAILLLYLLIGLCTYTEVALLSYPLFRDGNFSVWWAVYLTEGVVVAALLLLPRLPWLARHYDGVLMLVALLALSAIIIATSAFPDPYFNQHSSYVVIFISAIIYGIGSLRLWQAAVVGWTAALLAWAVIRTFGFWLDWGLYVQYAVLGNLVGMLICYALERRDRLMFLQSRLLELEKTALDQLAQELARMSREDALTRLANRRHFNETFQIEWDRARREQQWLALLFVDIDHFKPFNDSHGHLEGDSVLAAVGQALRSSLRRPGDMAARYGGEEFVLLLPATGMSGALEVAEQVQVAIKALGIVHRASSVADHLTASIGVAAMMPTTELRSAELIAQADAAVYAAKAAGRNRIMVALGEEFVAA